MKVFARMADTFRSLAVGYGSCIATDEVRCRRVGYAYREAPGDDVDTSWVFTAGDESEAYMDEPSNHGVYAVNTVANYDAEILAFLEAPPGSAFARDPKTGRFVNVARAGAIR